MQIQKQPPEVFCKKKGVLRTFTKFTGKHLCQSLFFSNVCEITRISKLSPAWKFKIHFTRITDVSPAFCNCQVKNILPPQKKKTRKNKNKALFKEKKAPGKIPLYQWSLEHFTTLCMTSVYFHFFLCLFIISSLV